MMDIKELESRMLVRISVSDDGCFEWQRALMSNGYANYKWREGGVQKQGYAHRIMWEAVNGPIPAGLEIDHLCENRKCCNPGHLEVVTHRENILRGRGVTARRARSKVCQRGHQYAFTEFGGRICNICIRIAAVTESIERQKNSVRRSIAKIRAYRVEIASLL